VSDTLRLRVVLVVCALVLGSAAISVRGVITSPTRVSPNSIAD